MSYQINRRRFLQYTSALAGGLVFDSFNLLGKNSPVLKFGIVTDSHYADREPSGTRYYRESIAKMKEAMEEMNKLGADFVVHLGDFKDQAESPTEETTLDYLKRLEEEFAAFRGPRYHVLGNHDADSITKQQFLGNVVNTGIARDKSYYSFDVKGYHFIVLDANFKSDGTPYDKGNYDWKDTFIPIEQLAWLRDDLQQTKLPAIIFVHQALDDEDDLDLCVKNAADVRKVITDSKKVLTVFQGHCHKERYHKMDGIHYCTLPGMVDYTGAENNSFSLIQVYSSGDISMVGFERAPDREIKR